MAKKKENASGKLRDQALAQLAELGFIPLKRTWLHGGRRF